MSTSPADGHSITAYANPQIDKDHRRRSSAFFKWHFSKDRARKYLSEAQKRAYIIVDNQLAAKAGWNDEILQIELQGLVDLEFDLDLPGSEGGEIEIILGDRSKRAADEDTIRHPSPVAKFRNSRTCGASVVLMPGAPLLSRSCLAKKKQVLLLLTLPIMLRSTATYLDLARISTAISRLPREKCRPPEPAHGFPVAEVTAAILEGSHPAELSLARIPKLLPLKWIDHRSLLG
jgi:hypothetical protein